MGCILARRKFVANDDIEGQDRAALEVFRELGLTDSEVDLLYTAFHDIDADGSNAIRPQELFSYFEMEETKFELTVFTLFDEDGSGLINFMEFVCVIWNLLTTPSKNVGSLVYLLADPSIAQAIKLTDVRNILEVIHRKKVEKNSTLAVLFTKLKNEYPGEINLKDFCKWTAENPFIISPVLILQLHLRRQIIGEKFWAKLTEDRLEDPEMGDLGFIKRLQQNVIGKINEFKRKQEEAEREQERLRKRGRGPGADARDNISRKESKLLGFFHLRQPSKKNLRSTNGVLVDLPDHDDDYYDKPVESMQVNKPSLNSADVNKLPMDGSVKKTDKNGYISPTKDSKKGSSKKMKKESKGEVENKTSSSGKYSTTDKELNSEKNGESEKRKKKKKQNDVDPSVTGETAPIQTRRRRSIVKPKIVLSEYQVKRKED